MRISGAILECFILYSMTFCILKHNKKKLIEYLNQLKDDPPTVDYYKSCVWVGGSPQKA